MNAVRATWVLAAAITVSTAAQARDIATKPTSHSDMVGKTGQMLSYNQPDHQKMMAMMQKMMKQMHANAAKAPSINASHPNPYDPLNDRAKERH